MLGTSTTILQRETDLSLSWLHSVAFSSECPTRLLNGLALAPTMWEA